jgi:starvation-inducible DNA-binding protein
MHKTRNDLSSSVRAEIAELLNARLADAIDLYLQTKQAHWNVRGPNFIALHELFDKMADEVSDYVDDLAERITALGGIAEGTVAAVGKHSKLKAYPLDASTSKKHIDALANAYAAFGKSVRKAIDQAGKAGDADTSDLFTGISRGVDKSLWFLEAHE